MRPSRLATLLGLLTAAVVWAPGAVPATAKIVYKTDTEPVGPNSQSPVLAAGCGKRHVLGGGAFISTGIATVNIAGTVTGELGTSELCPTNS